MSTRQCGGLGERQVCLIGAAAAELVHRSGRGHTFQKEHAPAEIGICA